MTKHYLSAEWQTQDATILVWPTASSDWSSNLDAIEHTYLALTREISNRQYVLLICFDEAHQQHVISLCKQNNCDLSQVKLLTIQTNDTWVRDYGPQFLYNDDNFHYLDLTFNAWGNQYTHQLDNAFAAKLHQTIKFKKSLYVKEDFIFEGGNLDINDDGIVLTNLNCTVNNNLSKSSIEDVQRKTKETLNANHVIGLQLKALQGDDTGGHIDTLARFVNNETIVYAAANDSSDPNHACLLDLEQQLQAYNKNTSPSYQLVPIVMPTNSARDDQGNILPSSYINFVFINGAVLVPLYNDQHDTLALNQFKQLCPDREIIGIDASELIKQYGSLHCASLHIPQKALHESWFHSAAK